MCLPSSATDRDERRGGPLLLPLEHGLRGLDPEEHLLSETGILVAGLHHVAGIWEKHVCKYMRSVQVVQLSSFPLFLVRVGGSQARRAAFILVKSSSTLYPVLPGSFAVY